MAKKLSYLPQVNYDISLYRKLTTILGSELTDLSKPCHFPKFSQYLEDIKHSLGISNDMIQQFKKINISSYTKFRLLNDDYTILFTIPLIYFSRFKKPDVSKLFMLFIALKFQSSLLHKHFKEYCNIDAYTYAYETISHKHLYKMKQGMANTVQYLAIEEYKKYKSKLESNTLTDENIMKMLYELRHRLSQSVKSFAESYYSIMKNKDSKLTQTGEDTEQEKVYHILDKLIMIMCSYGNIDQSALTKSTLVTGIRKEYAVSIVSEISTSDNGDSIKFIIHLIHRLFNLKTVCKESSRLLMIRKINTGIKFQNYSLRDLILKLIKSLPSGYIYKSLYDDQLVMFFCQYITLYLRGRIC